MQLSDYDAFPSDLPILVEDDIFLYPFMIAPIFVSDDKNIKAINDALDNNSLIIVIPSKEGYEGERVFDSIYDMGVIGSIMRKVALPDGRVKVLFQGLAKGKISKEISKNPLKATIELEESESYDTQKMEASISVLKDKVAKLSSVTNQFPPDLLKTIDDSLEPARVIDLVASTIKLNKDSAYELFSEKNLDERLLNLINKIVQEIEGVKLQKEIKTKVHNKIEKANKEYFLKEQLKQIQKELGGSNQRDEEIEEYLEKLEKLKPSLDEDVYEEISKQINKLARMHPDSADANVIQSYIEIVLDIPFGKLSKKRLEIDSVENQLERDHFSLKKPKERIVEYFAVKELLNLRGKSKDDKGTILCFAGPPGVGKTSLANSIAKALKRKLVRIALGGLEDVSELRGHRRTYIGAMPGRITQGLIEAKEMNPVIVLDEIDKVSRSFRGDPTSVLLEILDPEQNSNFRDLYLNFSIDLSSSIFIATANDVGSIPAPLRDRMEIIFVSSYTPSEKFQIAKKYLLPQELKKHGLKNQEVSISKVALEEIINKYTREAGVRNLRRRLAQILRKSAKILLKNSELKKVSISVKNLKEFLEKTIFEIEEVDKKNAIGVVNGLAWTSVGGDVLKIEAIKLRGKGAIQLTGSLGDVMKESARIAFSVAKVLIDEKKLKIDENLIPKTQKERDEKITLNQSEIYKRFDLHIHVPEGATPKDGPSAGITMLTAIASILSKREVRSDVAMTGELTLTGKVLPIGGLKEKLIAAYKAKVKKILICKKNFDRDLDDIPKEVLEALDIVVVESAIDVLNEALI